MLTSLFCVYRKCIIFFIFIKYSEVHNNRNLRKIQIWNLQVWFCCTLISICRQLYGNVSTLPFSETGTFCIYFSSGRKFIIFSDERNNVEFLADFLKSPTSIDDSLFKRALKHPEFVSLVFKTLEYEGKDVSSFFRIYSKCFLGISAILSVGKNECW